METNERKSNKSFIVIVIFILLIGFTTFLGFDIYLKYKDELLKYEELTIKNSTLASEYENLVLVQNQINSDLSQINNIDGNISKTKEELFSSIKKLEEKIINKQSDYKIAYLTFDDGPYYSTYKYLDVLDKYGVKATFFTIGSGKSVCYDNSSKDCTLLYKEIVDRGHVIANHTYSHAIFKGLYSSADAFMYQIKKHEDYIKSKTGVTTNIMRFPGGTATAGKLKEKIMSKLREANYGWVDWTASDGDGGALYSKQEAWNNFTKSIDQDIEVVLFHDYSSITLSILPDAIEYLRDNNYIILPLFYESVMIKK